MQPQNRGPFEDGSFPKALPMQCTPKWLWGILVFAGATKNVFTICVCTSVVRLTLMEQNVSMVHDVKRCEKRVVANGYQLQHGLLQTFKEVPLVESKTIWEKPEQKPYDTMVEIKFPMCWNPISSGCFSLNSTASFA